MPLAREWGRGLLAVGALGAVLLVADAGHAGSVSATRPIASTDASLEPGLTVEYYSRKLSRLRELRDWMKYKKGKPGPPLPSLDYPETNGAVLTATQTNQVGAKPEERPDNECGQCHTSGRHNRDQQLLPPEPGDIDVKRAGKQQERENPVENDLFEVDSLDDLTGVGKRNDL